MLRVVTIVLAGGLFTALVAAQEGKTGTQPGQTLPGPFTAFVVSNTDAPKPPEGVVSEDRSNLGDLARVGKFHDFVTHYGLDPTVAVFTRDLPKGGDDPLGKLLQALDQAVQKNRNARLHAFGVFLTLKGPFLETVDQPIQIKKIQDFANQLKLSAVPLALSQTETEQAKAYDVPADATVVVLVYVNQKVQARFAFTADKQLDDAAIQAVLGDVNKMIGAKK
jgi:hypothetical protein